MRIGLLFCNILGKKPHSTARLGRKRSILKYMKTPHLYAQSKHGSELYFANTPPGPSAYFELPFHGYALEARILYDEAHDDPWVVSIHGARGDFTKTNAVSFGLQQRGYSQLAMNLSGHSPSGVLPAEQTTLATNIQEAAAFYDYLNHARKKVVIAYSMGGTSALKLLGDHADDIDTLVLFYPGIYSKDAYDKHFGAPFHAAITEPFSYRNNDTIELLRAFSGKLLLIKGEYDGLDPLDFGKPAGGSAGEVEIDGQTYYSPIPKEVIELVYDAVPADRRQLIEVPHCGHSVALWMRDHPAEAEQLLDHIDTFIRR